MLDYKAIITCTRCRNLEGYSEEMLPIVAFGNGKAPFLMLSLNPSYNEYYKTPPPLSSLPKSTYRDKMTDLEIQQTIKEQETYFGRDYYKKWFDVAESFLNKLVSNRHGELSFGISKTQSNTTNVDICKCATTTIWGQLEKESKKRYVSNCLPFLIEQIFDDHVEGIIINGEGIYRELKKIFKSEEFLLQAKVTFLQDMSIPINHATKKCKVFRGLIEKVDGKKILFFGTSQRISSDHYGQFGKETDRSRVAELIQDFIDSMVF